MISKLIVKHLKSHRRVNIPGVGAFMVKGSGIIFSELLKSDDGVVNTLLREQGLSEIESAATLDRFIFELRHSTENVGGEFEVKGVGLLRRESGGRLAFIPAPNECETPESEEVAKLEELPKETIERVEEPPKEDTPAVDDEVESTVPTAEDHKDLQDQDQNSSRYTPSRIKELYSHTQKFRDDDVVGDLKYSKRQKPLGGYSYVREKPSKRGVDKVLLFGVLAAIVALGVIAYGCYVANVEEVTDVLIKLGLKSVE